MISTVSYDSLAAFQAAHRLEIESAVTEARDDAERFIIRLPRGLDADAFRGEALLAVWRAALAYRAEIGVPFRLWAKLTVDYALRQERRRQCAFSDRQQKAPTESEVQISGRRFRLVSIEDSLERCGGEPPACMLDPRAGPEGQVIQRECAEFVLGQVAMLPRRDCDALLERFWVKRAWLRSECTSGCGLRAHIKLLRRPWHACADT
jgi:hypothetical protein